MKANIKNSFLLAALIAALDLLPPGRVAAQAFTTLHSFSGGESIRGLISSGNTVYGATTGTVFAVYTDGSGFTNLHSFTDGASLSAGILLSGNTLYGTTSGGSSSNGAVFKVYTDSTGFTNLHNFTASAPFTNSDGYVVYTNSDGAYPSGLILSNNALYGTASGGGVWGSGTVFALNADGTGFTNLHQFTSLTNSFSMGPPISVNGDGAYPGGLILSGSTLYGTTDVGGGSGRGALFAINTDGTGFTNLYYFPRDIGLGSSHGEVILSGNTLYGTALENSGQPTPPTVTWFALNTDGSGFRTLYNGSLPEGLILSGGALYGWALSGGGCQFCGGPWSTLLKVNTDGTGGTILHTLAPITEGTYPLAGLIASGNTLYGTAQHTVSIVSSGNGTIFAARTDGTAFTVLHTFTATSTDSFGTYTNSDGAFPNNLILSGNTLYGTTTGGGSGGSGTIFSISLPPQLTITPSGENVILSWPTNFSGYTLQSTTNLVSPSVWTTNSPKPFVIAGQNVVTNSLSGPQQFYRLKQ